MTEPRKMRFMGDIIATLFGRTAPLKNEADDSIEKSKIARDFQILTTNELANSLNRLESILIADKKVN